MKKIQNYGEENIDEKDMMESPHNIIVSKRTWMNRWFNNTENISQSVIEAVKNSESKESEESEMSESTAGISNVEGDDGCMSHMVDNIQGRGEIYYEKNAMGGKRS